MRVGVGSVPPLLRAGAFHRSLAPFPGDLADGTPDWLHIRHTFRGMKKPRTRRGQSSMDMQDHEKRGSMVSTSP
jgi:hypothetical protein